MASIVSIEEITNGDKELESALAECAKYTKVLSLLSYQKTHPMKSSFVVIEHAVASNFQKDGF